MRTDQTAPQNNGSIQFPLDQSIPFGLISKIVKVRVKENLAKAEAKGKGLTFKRMKEK